ncbi:phosphoribosylanthranilate isomerase [Chlorobaculum sp. MV4-Y]|uniref:phosphoribosylanthranilate isomerase n=1 Tax=Chlorobaculum sp. MV4-Y TaxID=2976335 RepID=UPI0021AEB5F2|nr:phosphoribosylanthranilate isomerase [Chlorobaculum sp. MV4-Y]UWX56963.1 phosphoribosylanthranilate isomerase [Chlorobaculum sp. MV4-Y]
MTKIKICGITRPEDALEASLWGADALGFNFSRSSPRRIDADAARAIVARLPPLVSAVGVFVEQSPEEVADLCRFCNLQAAQLHSDEYDADKTLRIEGVRVIRVFRPSPGFEVSQVREFADATGCRSFLFDAYSPVMAGGTGESIKAQTAVSLFEETRDFSWALLAGGLKPGNVGDAVMLVRPWGVDTASGVESAPGIKDALKIKQFVEAVRKADRSLTNCC